MAMSKDFGAYELKEKIGAGAMASVHLAVQKALQRPVVLKIIYPHLAEDEKLVQRFEREARTAAMLRHENIVQVIDFGRQDDVAYICMEFVEGMDLKKWTEAHGTPPIEMALLMVRDLMRGMEHAHSHRVVHRDIKPANVMLTPDGTIKIMDFGLARSGNENTSQMTMVGSVLGTPAYMSPEQATGEVVDERSDIFSAGVVAYELLGGHRPFSGDSYSTVLRAILTVEPPDVSQFNPLIPEEVSRIVRGMLQKDVSKRYASSRQVREELEAVIEKLELHRGRDLLREYALDPKTVSDTWRRKRMSRHMDQGMFYENMGLGKIDDALLEFRRVLFLDPANPQAKDHVKKLEREREKVARNAPAQPAPGELPTMMLAPGAAGAATEADAGATMMIPPAPAPPAGKGAPKQAPPQAKKPEPARPKEKPKEKPPAAAKETAGPGSRKGGLPLPALIGGIAVVAAIVLFVLHPWSGGTPAGSDAAGPAHTGLAASGTGTPATGAPALGTAPPSQQDTSHAAAIPPPASATTTVPAPGKPSATTGSGTGATAGGTAPPPAQAVAKPLAPPPAAVKPVVEKPAATPGATAHPPLVLAPPAATTKPATGSAKGATAKPGGMFGMPENPPPGTEPPPPTPVPPLGDAKLLVIVNPTASSFSIDDEVRGKNQKQFRAELKPGRHTIRVVHPTLGPHEWTVELKPGDHPTLTWDFLATGMGSVRVEVNGGWAEIYLDGEAMKLQAPAVLSGVLPGKHDVMLVREGYTVEGGGKSVVVKAGQQATISFKLVTKK